MTLKVKCHVGWTPIEADSEPASRGEDNLKTLQAVFAEYRPMREGHAVSPKEVTE
jgi:hypothetical protein